MKQLVTSYNQEASKAIEEAIENANDPLDQKGVFCLAIQLFWVLMMMTSQNHLKRHGINFMHNKWHDTIEKEFCNMIKHNV